MIPDHIKLEKNDILLIIHCINNLPPMEIDKHCSRIIDALSIFGNNVVLIPVREGPEWDFTIVNVPQSITRTLLKKVAKSKRL